MSTFLPRQVLRRELATKEVSNFFFCLFVLMRNFHSTWFCTRAFGVCNFFFAVFSNSLKFCTNVQKHQFLRKIEFFWKIFQNFVILSYFFQILPQRWDWLGNSHNQSFEELVSFGANIFYFNKIRFLRDIFKVLQNLIFPT